MLKDASFSLEEIKEGHQVYVVAPLIEDEEGESNMNDVVKLKEKFDMAFQNRISVEILHGKMKNQEKDEVFEENRPLDDSRVTDRATIVVKKGSVRPFDKDE